MTIGVPIVTCLPRLYQQQCTSRQKQSKTVKQQKSPLVYQSSHVYTESAEYTKSTSASAKYTKPLPDMCRLSGDDFFYVSTGRHLGASAHDTVAFLAVHTPLGGVFTPSRTRTPWTSLCMVHHAYTEYFEIWSFNSQENH